jgi:hypothetical protein
VQWSLLQQQGVVRYLGLGVMIITLVPAGRQNYLQVCHGSGKSHLVDDENFSHDVVDVVFLLRDSRELAVAVSAAEAGIVQAINNLFFVYFFGGLECVGHSFAYVAHL